MKKECDVLVIGGGPGGYSAAIRAGQLGLKTIIVEKEKFGGTCLNVGCIPTKAFVHCANVIDELKKGAMYGIKSHLDELDLKEFQKKKNANVAKLVGGVEFLLKAAKVESVRGQATFVNSNTVTVKPESGETVEISGKNVILAMGTRPKIIKGLEFDGKRVLSSTEALDLAEVPKRLGVVGAGVVGMEFASIFARLGSKVTVIEVLDKILPTEDKNAVDLLQKSMSANGTEFLLSANIKEVVRKPECVEMKIQCGNETKTVEVDTLIVAAGRDTNLDGINFEATGVKTEKGRVLVDDHMLTNVKNVYAVGDIVPSIQLAHAAYEEGAVAAENIAGNNKTVSYAAIPRCTYSAPEICAVGLSEEEAKAKSKDVKSFKVSFGAIGKAVIEGKDEGFIKLIVDTKYGEILGSVVVGHGISDLITGPTVAMAMEGTVDALADTVIAHPSLSEAIKEVALLAAGRPLHVK